MALALITLAAALILAGLTLVAVGLRGRRLHDHPVCAKCRFDLEGIYPASPTCPECGRILSASGAIRRGARRRRPALAFGGAGMLLLGCVLAAPFALPAGVDPLTKLMPDWMLVWRAGHASPDVARPALVELERRWWDASKGAFTGPKAQLGDVLDHAIDWQLATERPWLGEFDAFIFAAHDAGLFTDERIRKYVDGAYRIDFEWRSRRRPGETTDVRLKTVATERGPSGLFVVHNRLVDGALDGAGDVSIDMPMRSWRGRASLSRGWWSDQNGGPGWHFTTAQGDVTIDAHPGAHELLATHAFSVWPSPRPEADGFELPATLEWTESHTWRLEIVEPDQPLVRLIREDRAREQARRGTAITQWSVEDGPEARHLVCVISTRKPPAPIACEIVVEYGNGEVAHTERYTGVPQEGVDGFGWSLRFKLPERQDETVSIVLRSSVEVAMQMRRNVEEIVDVEIRFTDVPLEPERNEYGHMKDILPDGVDEADASGW